MQGTEKERRNKGGKGKDGSQDNGIDIVVVCTDLAGKELHRQVGVGILVTLGSLNCVMVAHCLRIPEI